MNLDPYLLPHTKFNSKSLIYLNVKVKIVKLLEQSIEENIDDLGLIKTY